jgi:hypothetical protein
MRLFKRGNAKNNGDFGKITDLPDFRDAWEMEIGN